MEYVTYYWHLIPLGYKQGTCSNSMQKLVTLSKVKSNSGCINFIDECFIAEVLKVCRTPGPTACYKHPVAYVNIPSLWIAMFFTSSGSWNNHLKVFLTPIPYPLAAGID